MKKSPNSLAKLFLDWTRVPEQGPDKRQAVAKVCEEHDVSPSYPPSRFIKCFTGTSFLRFFHIDIRRRPLHDESVDMTAAAPACAAASPPAHTEDGMIRVEPFATTEQLGEIRGRLRKLEHSKGFLAQVFELRCRQLCPRDLLVAWVPAKRKASKPSKAGAPPAPPTLAPTTPPTLAPTTPHTPPAPPTKRPLGFLRRSLKFDKEANKSHLYIDFVWVVPEMRGRRIGKLLLCSGLKLGKSKDVRLQVAGSEDNRVAVRLYESVGFEWIDSQKTEMRLAADKVDAAVHALSLPSSTRMGGSNRGHSVSAEESSAVGVACGSNAINGAEGMTSAAGGGDSKCQQYRAQEESSHHAFNHDRGCEAQGAPAA